MIRTSSRLNVVENFSSLNVGVAMKYAANSFSERKY